MRKPMTIAVVVCVAVAAAMLGLILYLAFSASQVACEACMSFRGRTVCREALGPSRDEAARTAVDNACSFLASGMTEVVECTTRTPPQSLTCTTP
jgi:hypothetical protein